MKHIKLVSWVIFCLVILTSCNQKKSKKDTKIDTSISKIEVINFHSTNRCFTCNEIEKNTKYTLNTYFSEELKSGKITTQITNVDKKENYALAEKFEATGTALFLNVISNGKEEKIDLTNLAFSKGKDKDKFSKELKTKIETALKKL